MSSIDPVLSHLKATETQLPSFTLPSASERKSVMRRIWETICTIARAIFCCGCCPRHKGEKLDPNRIQVQTASSTLLMQNLQHKHVTNAAVEPKEDSSEKTEKADAAPKDLAACLGERVKRIPRKSDNPLKDMALDLADDVMTELSRDVMQKHVIPHVPMLSKLAEELTKALKFLCVSIEDLKTHFSEAISPNMPKTLTEEEKGDPFLVLFDLLDLVVFFRGAYNESFNKSQLPAIVRHYIIGEIKNGEKPTLKWLPDEAQKYVEPAIDWLFASYKQKKAFPFKQFIKDNQEKYKNLTADSFVKERPKIMEGTLKKISENILNALVSSISQLNGIKDIGQQEMLTKTIFELIDRNSLQVSRKVVERFADVLGEVDLSELIQHSLPHLVAQLQGVGKPVDAKTFSEQGRDLIDILFPIVRDETGTEVRALSILWDQVHIPQAIEAIKPPSAADAIDKMMNAFRHADNPLKMTKTGKDSLASLEGRAQMRMIRIAQSKINHLAATTIEKVVVMMQDPKYIDELVGYNVIPNALDKIISIFAQQVLSRNIDADFIACFKAIINAENPSGKQAQEAITEVILKWQRLMLSPEHGFDAFKQYCKDLANPDSKGIDIAQFVALVGPTLLELRDRLIEVKKANGGEIGDDKIAEVMTEFFNPTHNTKAEESLATLFGNLIGNGGTDLTIGIEQIAAKLAQRASYDGVQFIHPKGEEALTGKMLMPFISSVAEKLTAADSHDPKAVKEAIEATLQRENPKERKKNALPAEGQLLAYVNESNKQNKAQYARNVAEELLRAVAFNEGDVRFNLKEMGVQAKDLEPYVVKMGNALTEIKRVKKSVDLNDAKMVLHSSANPKIAAYSDFIKTVLNEGNFFGDKWGGSLLKMGVRAYVDPIGKVVVDSLPTTKEVLAITLNSLRQMWTMQVEENGGVVERIDINKVLCRVEMPKKSEVEVEANRDYRLSQLTALISDFSSQIAYHSLATKESGFFMRLAGGIASRVTTRYASPESLTAAIKTVYQKLFGQKEQNRQILAAVFSEAIRDLGVAAQSLDGSSVYTRAISQT